MIKKSIFIWLLIIPLGILNGALREKILVPLIGAEYALPVSGIILCILIFMVSFIFIPRLGNGTSETYWRMGFLWLVLTLIFETGLGFLMGKTFGEILKAYDITTGNLWLLVVIMTGCMPRLVALARRPEKAA